VKKRSRNRCPDCPQHCFCGSTHRLEQNHLGGRNHVGWLFLPFCLDPHHADFHRLCEKAGIDFRKTKNKLFGQIQALKAQLIGMWMVVDAMEKHVKDQEDSTDESGT
jgi:hypothetical protein